MTTKINGLTISQAANGTSICEDLTDLPRAFNARWSDAEIQQFVDGIVKVAREDCSLHCATLEEHNAKSEEVRRSEGLELFDRIVSEIEPAGLTRFQKAFFWASAWWWLYHPRMQAGIYLSNKSDICDAQKKISDLLLPVLPEAVKKSVEGMSFASVASNMNHFALMFADKDKQIRRIVTDSQLFELNGVFGYFYLDIMDDGKPVVRACCERGGGRVFFDGVRLMAHKRFRTCAPRVIPIHGGYKVNSTECTIVNGILFDLIDVDDKVAHTSGALFGICDFNQSDAKNAALLAEASGARMKVEGGEAVLDGMVLIPSGHFMPGAVTLLPNGFTGVDWSEWHAHYRERRGI